MHPPHGQPNYRTSPFTRLRIVNSLVATCFLLGISPATYLGDVFQRIDTHPADRVHELTPRLWKDLFADNPMTGSIDMTVVRAHPDATRGPP